MTDARLPERWLSDRRILRLSDSAFRTFITALLWSVSNRTEGRLDLDDLDLIPGARVSDLPELAAAGLLTRGVGRVDLVDFGETQTSRDQLAQLERYRRAEREKKARQRANKAEQEATGRETEAPDTKPPSEGNTTGTRPRGQSRGTAQARQEQEQGTYRGAHEDWPAVVCTTTGHHGCGWQTTDSCRDCSAVSA